MQRNEVGERLEYEVVEVMKALHKYQAGHLLVEFGLALLAGYAAAEAKHTALRLVR